MSGLLGGADSLLLGCNAPTLTFIHLPPSRRLPRPFWSLRMTLKLVHICHLLRHLFVIKTALIDCRLW
jgi:hypothetical protein